MERKLAKSAGPLSLGTVTQRTLRNQQWSLLCVLGVQKMEARPLRMRSTPCSTGLEPGAKKQASTAWDECSKVKLRYSTWKQRKARQNFKKNQKTKPKRIKAPSSVTAPWSRPERQVQDDSDVMSDKTAIGLPGSRGSRKGNDVCGGLATYISWHICGFPGRKCLLRHYAFCSWVKI